MQPPQAREGHSGGPTLMHLHMLPRRNELALQHLGARPAEGDTRREEVGLPVPSVSVSVSVAVSLCCAFNG